MVQVFDNKTTRPSSLVTIAYLKALLDEGNDHLGIFIPLVIDVVSQFNRTFISAEIQEKLAIRHGISMPVQIISTILKRLVNKHIILNENGVYKINPDKIIPEVKVGVLKGQIEIEQRRLGKALQEYSNKFGVVLETEDDALEMLLRFLDEEQVGMLIDVIHEPSDTKKGDKKERGVVAAFVCEVVHQDPTMGAILRKMLEGMVLYNAAFLPNFETLTNRFKGLRVIFDSVIVRQALGYEGKAMQALVRESVDVLKANGVQCLVLDKTILEIQRLLAMYEIRLATPEGRNSLRPVPMSRHFLTQRFSPADVREMSALLEYEVNSSGFQIFRSPPRVGIFTAGEKALSIRLSDPNKKDENEPRVIHDVDCVAAILTLRKNHRSLSLDNAKAVFTTVSSLTIRNIRFWWEEDEKETGVSPVVHFRALINIAWLKKPSLAVNLKVQELVALCSVALQPSQGTWKRFLSHLDKLHETHRVSSDEVAAILVSSMSDNLLRDVELENDDPNSIDATCLDEVVERVTKTYAAQAEERVRRVTEDYENKLAASLENEREAISRAEIITRESEERYRKMSLAIEGRARRWAGIVTFVLHWGARFIVIIGGLTLLDGHSFHSGLAGIIVGIGVVLFVVLEIVGVLGHVKKVFFEMEITLTKLFRKWLGVEANT